jgi:hypothetical protein
MKKLLYSTALVAILALSTAAQAGNGTNPNGLPFRTIQEQIAQTNADLDALAASTGASIASLEADVSAAQTAIADLQSQISSNDADILSLSADTVANAAAIAALETDTAQLQSDLDNLEAEVATKQDVLIGSCPAGSSLRVVYPNGSFLCELDDIITNQIRTIRVGSYVSMSGSYTAQRNAFSGNCPSGFFVASGGNRNQYLGTSRNVNISESRQDSNGWLVRFSRSYANSFNRVRAQALCIRSLN